MKNLKFTSISKAKKDVKVSYLTKTASSAKLIHSAKESNVLTTGLYLAPAKQSGYEVCSHSTPECRMACLNSSGRAAMELIAGKSKIADCRNTKTKLFFENQTFFMEWLISEIIRDQKVAANKGMFYAVRLNCTSDIDWANILYNGLNIFQIFPEVQFYDYTKNWNKFNNIASNYHLTFSYTGKNASKAKELLAKGFNVAVVFSTKANKPLPTKLAGYNVIDGDLTDYRPSDGNGVIVGLRFKVIAGKANQIEALKSVFIIDENNLTDNTLAKSITEQAVSLEQLN